MTENRLHRPTTENRLHRRLTENRLHRPTTEKLLHRMMMVLILALLPVPLLANEGGEAVAVTPWMIIPFGALLLAIAVMPFINRHWWEHHYPVVAVGLGLVSVAYYLFVLHAPGRLLVTLMEYISFIVLIGSLFVVAGGIHIQIRGKSRPLSNVFLLAIGAVLANIVGTTGASMILIRPYIRVNKYRIKPFHVVFFIFVVSNMGGALTPIGDPPLFLGYLKGVPFFWVVEQVWLPWLVGMALVLAVFYGLDTLSLRRLPAARLHEAKEAHEEGAAEGVQNIFFLAVILVAVFITDPPFVREGLMVAAALGSYFTTKHGIHKKNDFNFIPIKEVAILFLGIFATMIPALDWLETNATALGIETAGQFYWATGFLSSFLDNAPTYLNFLSAQIGLFVSPDIVTGVLHAVATRGADLAQLTGPHAEAIRTTYETLLRYHYDLVVNGSAGTTDIAIAYLLGNHPLHLQAISLGAVFFGACTYIGNGPNFMVKSIAQQAGVECPSFFGYIVKYTIPVLLPIFFVIWLLFFR
jgi:Na+/H+ antiporter NhaD/arsenite permease-like protein